MRWENAKISEICCGIYDGPHATPPVSKDGAIFLGISNITPDGHLDLSDPKYISENDLPKWTKRVTPQPGDIVFSYEATLNLYAIIPEGFWGCLGRRMALIRPNEEKVLGKFLYYYFFSDEWRGTIAENTVIGATVDRIPLIRFPDFPVSFPSVEKQKTIADILSAYDDLIENNQKQIKLLEEAAQRLYREWFVDLHFPGHETTPIVDGVPEGWRACTLKEICTLKKDTVSAEKVATDTPYIGLEHMPRVDFCLSNWGFAEDVSSNKFRYREDDIIFGKIRPYFHKVGFALNSGVASTDSFVLNTNDKLWGLLLMTVFDKAFVDYTYQTCKEGAKMPRADWKQMEKYPVLIPSESIRKKFEEFIWKTTRRIKVLALQNHALSEARDRLLPKLMSGEIEV
jgi:type I restriction enzyme S subunit